jgi:hypothetical protein
MAIPATIPNNYNLPTPIGPKPALGTGLCERNAEVFVQEALEQIYDALQALYALQYAIYQLTSGTGTQVTHREVNQLNVGLKYEDVAGNVVGLNIINPNVTPIYVKIYDQALIPTGADTPLDTIAVPPGPAGAVILTNNAGIYTIATKLWIRATLLLVDADDTAPAAGLTVRITYINA